MSNIYINLYTCWFYIQKAKLIWTRVMTDNIKESQESMDSKVSPDAGLEKQA
jgi:hypothetical protein